MFPSRRRRRDEWSRFIQEHDGLMMSTEHRRRTFPAFSSLLKDSIDILVNMFTHFIASLNEKTGVFFKNRRRRSETGGVRLTEEKNRNKKQNLMC